MQSFCAAPCAGEPPDTAADSIPAHFGLLMHELLMEDCWARHRAAILADAGLRQAVADVLLTHCLPRVAANVAALHRAGLPLPKASTHMQALAEALSSGVLELADGSQLGPAGAAAAVGHAARAVLLLPSQRADSEPARDFVNARISAAQLLSCCCGRISGGVVAAWLGVSSTGAPFSGARAVPDRAAAEAFQDEARVAGWAIVAAAPHLEATLRSMVAATEDPATLGPQGPDARLRSVDHYCHFISCAFLLPSGGQHQQCSAAHLAVWAAAMQSASRLLPLLARLAGRLRQHGHEPKGTAVLARVVLGFVAAGLPSVPWLEPVTTAAAEPHDSPARRSAADGLLHTHLTLCRLVNWLAAEAQGCGLWQLDNLAEQWPLLLRSFDHAWRT